MHIRLSTCVTISVRVRVIREIVKTAVLRIANGEKSSFDQFPQSLFIGFVGGLFFVTGIGLYVCDCQKLIVPWKENKFASYMNQDKKRKQMYALSSFVQSRKSCLHKQHSKLERVLNLAFTIWINLWTIKSGRVFFPQAHLDEKGKTLSSY